MPELIAGFVLEVFQNKILILMVINILLLFLGMLLDTSSIILMLTPILIPIASQLGINPVALGIIIVVNTSIGAITPPMAVNLFVACRISKITLEEISRSIVPYLFIEIAVTLFISYFPESFMWVPKLAE
jgi:C4-dicarboxylate transporter DctM subunit